MTIDTVLPAELVDAARKVVETNKALGRKFALAESCTGGLVAAAITEIPGSSEVLLGGFVLLGGEHAFGAGAYSIDNKRAAA